MSHRALLAREGPTGRYDLYESSLAGYAIDPSIARAEVADGRADRLAAGLPVADAIDRVDVVTHEALYVLGERERSYRVLTFLVPTAGGLLRGDSVVGEGALVAIEDLDDPEPDGYLRGWFVAARDCVGASVDRGAVAETEAVAVLRDRLAQFAGEDVEVIDLPRE